MKSFFRNEVQYKKGEVHALRGHNSVEGKAKDSGHPSTTCDEWCKRKGDLACTYISD